MTIPESSHRGSKLAVAAVAAVTLLAACGDTGGTASEGSESASTDSLADMSSVNLTIADFDPENATHTAPLEAWADAVTERTDGKITFDSYYSASLIPADEMLTGIGDGVADVGRIVGSYYPEELPISNWIMGLGSTASDSYPHGMIQGAATSHEIVMNSEEFQDEFTEQNLVPLLAINPSQQYDLLCTEPFETPDEANGIRARTLGEIWVSEVSSMNVEPVPLGINELYEGLQRGVIECATAPVNSFIDNAVWEIATHHVPVNMSQLNALQLTINQDTWESLPEEAQNIMREEAVSAWGEMMEHQMSNYERFATEGVDDYGVTMHDPRELDAALEVHQEQVIEDMLESAPESIEDPEAYVDEYLNTQQKWLDFTTDDMQLEINDRDPESILDSYRDQSDVNLDALLEELRDI